MDQMNISITNELAGYVRGKVKSGRYNNASEVVRDALRRMEQEDQRILRTGADTVRDFADDFTPHQLEQIRSRVLEGIAQIERGEYTEYRGKPGLRRLTEEIKARGRGQIQQAASK